MKSKEYNIKLYQNLKEIFEKEDREIKEFKKKCKKVYENLRILRIVYEDVLNPDISDLAISYEIRGIQVDINKLWENYKKIIKAIRLYELAKISNNINDYKKFMEYTNDIIKEVKEVAKEILNNKISFWETGVKYKKTKEYLG